MHAPFKETFWRHHCGQTQRKAPRSQTTKRGLSVRVEAAASDQVSEVVVVGAGWGGLSVAHALSKDPGDARAAGNLVYMVHAAPPQLTPTPLARLF